jgi:hypothetical protein
MEAARFLAIFASISGAIFCCIIAVFDLSGKQSSAAREARMAEHRMNARLLRLNI